MSLKLQFEISHKEYHYVDYIGLLFDTIILPMIPKTCMTIVVCVFKRFSTTILVITVVVYIYLLLLQIPIVILAIKGIKREIANCLSDDPEEAIDPKMKEIHYIDGVPKKKKISGELRR
jgi:hypothetical protein